MNNRQIIGRDGIVTYNCTSLDLFKMKTKMESKTKDYILLFCYTLLSTPSPSVLHIIDFIFQLFLLLRIHSVPVDIDLTEM